MNGIQLAHTADLPQSTLDAARALLDDAFAGELTEDDWEHGLGGLHAIAWADGVLVGHASLIQRRLLYGGRALRAGYVEAVAVRAGHRRRGYAAAMMAELERLIRGGYQLGALGSTDEAVPFYTGRGWQPWRGPLWALTPHGVVRTSEEDGYVFVLAIDPELDLSRPLTCDWRDGDVW
jgi:aminoglycoside 2'-N-acetyltransferase I